MHYSATKFFSVQRPLTKTTSSAYICFQLSVEQQVALLLLLCNNYCSSALLKIPNLLENSKIVIIESADYVSYDDMFGINYLVVFK